jgi:CheY-like chemotaxis protein
VAAADELRPDLVVLDVMLREASGFEVATQLAALSQPPDVVLVSSRDAADFGPRIEHSPARGFIAKADLSGWRLRALVEGK